jgi:hypothetical protein
MLVTAFWSTMMKKLHRARAAFAALMGALVFGLTACRTDLPSAPRAPEIIAPTEPPANLLGLDLGGVLGGVVSGVTGTVSGLLNLVLFPCQTPSYGSVMQTVGRYGGTIKVGPHSLYIPAGALSGPVAITATASSGKQVKVDFQPHGLRFQEPATLTLSYAHCSTQPERPTIVYVDDGLTILERFPTVNDRYRDRVVGRIDHFSGYAFAD